MEVADWISNRQAIINSYHDVEKLDGEVENLSQEVKDLEDKLDDKAK